MFPQHYLMKLAPIFIDVTLYVCSHHFISRYAKHIITASIITYVSICFTSIPLISCCTLNGKDMYDQRSKWMTSVRTHLRIQYLFSGLCLEIKRKVRNTFFLSCFLQLIHFHFVSSLLLWQDDNRYVYRKKIFCFHKNGINIWCVTVYWLKVYIFHYLSHSIRHRYSIDKLEI